MKKIIKDDLPYDQNYVYQFNNTYTKATPITDWDELIASKRTCCLMGYLLADCKFQKAGGYSDNFGCLQLNDEQGVDGFQSYVGFCCYEIVTKGHKSASEALVWFVDTYAIILKEI